jgi:Putative MetA-pathway of phenol degradation
MKTKARIAGKLWKLAATCLVFVSAAGSVAVAGSVTQPGETVGLGAGAPLPQGLYFVDTADWGVRTTTPRSELGVNIPVLAWSTPWTLFGGRFEVVGAAPELEAGTFGGVGAGAYNASMYNPALLGFLAWNLGGGFNFSYALGGYFDVSAPLAWSTSSLNQRFALTYNGGGWDLTANVIYGIQFDQFTAGRAQVSPCPAPFAGSGCNPDFVNLDLTATHTFGKWELGAVGFGSWDVTSPIGTYARQSQFALGGLIGYNFGPVTLQAYLTTDVYQQNYGGYDTRFWMRLVIPLWSPAAPPPIATKG